jgi:hypothetical protein
MDFYQQTKTCMQKHSLATNSTFGWSPKYYDTIKDMLYNGQLCQSGLAVPLYDLNQTHSAALNFSGKLNTRTEGLCIEVSSVVTDQGEYRNFDKDVPECLAANRGSHC